MLRELPFYIAGLSLMAVCGVALTTPYYFVAPLIPLSLLGMLVLYRFPQWGLLALAFLVPLEGLFAGNNLFTGAKLIGIALIGIASLKILRREIPLETLKTPLWYPIILLIFVFFMSSAYSPYPQLSNTTLRQLVTAISVFYIALTLKNHIDLVMLMRVIVVSVAITAFLPLISSEHTVEERAIGLLTDPNYFALLLTTAIPMALYLCFYERYRLLKLVWIGALALILLAFQKTLSRSGIVILVISFMLLAWHYREELRRLTAAQVGLIFVGGILALMITFASLPESYRDRILSITNITSGVEAFDDRSMGRRTSYIVVGMNVFLENPVIGSGPGTFPVHYAKTGYATAFSLDSDDPELFRRAHNTYLETLAETGALGLVALLAIMLLGIRQFMRARRIALRHQQFQHAHMIAHMGISLVAIMLFMLFLTGLTNKFLWILLAMGSQLLDHANRMSPVTSPEDQRGRHEQG
ncbi:MAG: O-antigen ligase family protein [Ketobacteraceae bacterium]|nr:O-antigen ligase family protein [Ketobacteraceae bacterium]